MGEHIFWGSSGSDHRRRNGLGKCALKAVPVRGPADGALPFGKAPSSVSKHEGRGDATGYLAELPDHLAATTPWHPHWEGRGTCL